MIHVENRHPVNSITLESTRQGAEMRQRHSMVISGKQHSTLGPLFGVSIIALLRFMRRVLTLLFSGFIISIFHLRRKVIRPNEEQPQKYDIEPVKADQALKLATELEDQFITVASHEFKTPMTAISGHAQLLLRRLSRVQELSSEMELIRISIESIDGQTRRLNALVNELLELSSIRAGKMDLHMEKCDVVDIGRQVVEQESFLTDRSIALIAPSTPIMLQADCTRVNQVVVNLVDNALKYSSPQSHVEVQMSQNENVALIEVRDCGPGIPEDQQAHLFEPFYRGPYLQASPKSGLGLGLTICKEIVEHHGGRIWFESHESTGSSFFVELPLRQ
jgi:signal transduction histidine kinase